MLDTAVSPLTVGTSGLGRTADIAAVTARAALASGLLIDTSNSYAGGLSEQTLGAALGELRGAERAAAASRIVTKADADPSTHRFDRDRVLRSAEESLARLGVDRVPLLHLHDPYSVSFEEATGPGGLVAGLIQLRESGVAGAIGIAAGPVPLVARYVETGLFDAVLVHNRYTLVDRSAQRLFEDAAARGMTVFNAAPFGGGILAHGAASGAGYSYGSASVELRAWVARVEHLCELYGVALPALALHLSLRAPFIHSTVVGVSSPQRLAELEALVAASIPEGLWAEFTALPAAPTPIDDEQKGGR
jgi:D-threo-aldose 1-dehydrogenase